MQELSCALYKGHLPALVAALQGSLAAALAALKFDQRMSLLAQLAEPGGHAAHCVTVRPEVRLQSQGVLMVWSAHAPAGFQPTMVLWQLLCIQPQ